MLSGNGIYFSGWARFSDGISQSIKDKKKEKKNGVILEKYNNQGRQKTDPTLIPGYSDRSRRRLFFSVIDFRRSRRKKSKFFERAEKPEK